MRIWHFKLRNIRGYAAYLGHWLDILIVTSIRAYNTQEELDILIVASIRALC